MSGSGSEKRRRTAELKFRDTPEQAALLKAEADRAGLSLAALLRYRCTGERPLRASRTPPLDRQLACQLLAAFGDLAQAVRALELADASPLEIEAMQRDLADMRSAVFEALGRTP